MAWATKIPANAPMMPMMIVTMHPMGCMLGHEDPRDEADDDAREEGADDARGFHGRHPTIDWPSRASATSRETARKYFFR